MEEVPDLVSSPETDLNVGGQLVLEIEDSPGNWTLVGNQPFAYPLVNWGPTASFAEGTYRAYQIGNGQSFAGYSIPSETYLI
jgi:hypothetical protein